MAARQDQLYMAKLAEQVGNFDDMMNSMTKLVSELSQHDEVTEEECNLLITAYKKVIGARRVSWNTIYSIEQKEEEHGNTQHANWAKEYRCRIEIEISEICYGLLKLLDGKLLVGTRCFGESKVLYLKMKGDYYRYLAEVKVGDEKKQVAECALNAYKSAQDIAYNELAPIHPTRLGLALNFSIFYYDILNIFDCACSVAQKALNEAITELVELDEDSSQDDIILILRLLRENLTMWKFDMQSKTRDELHVVRSTTTAHKGRQRRRCCNDRYAVAMSVPNQPINGVPSIFAIQDEIKEAAKPSNQEQKEY